MDFRCWEGIFRRLRESAAAGEVRGYRFGNYTVLDPESFKVITNKKVVRFSELEEILDKTFSNRVKCVIRKIFSRKKFSKIDEAYLLSVEKFCRSQAEAADKLSQEGLFELLKNRTGLPTEQNIKIYLQNILNDTEAEKLSIEISAM